MPCKRTSTAKQLAVQWTSEAVRVCGIPKVIVSDRDPRFTSEWWMYVTQMVGTTQELSTLCHQQMDGKCENAIKTVKRVLKAFVDYAGKEWVDLLPLVEFNHNATPNSTGVSPYEIDVGRIPSVTSLTDWFAPKLRLQ